ncbi:MAG: discoidin domain-containing protein [bacterium]|nr:discoidin domain-containing protein [bacterium]
MSSNFQFYASFGKMTKAIIATIILCVFLGFSLTAYAAKILEVKASSYQEPNAPENTTDSNLDTRWSAEGDGEWIQFNLGGTKKVKNISIAFYNGDQRISTFDVVVSENPWFSDYNIILNNQQSSGNSIQLEHFNLNVNARYIRIVGHGNSVNKWNSYTEISIEADEVISSIWLIASNSPDSADGNDSGYKNIGHWDVDREGAVGTFGTSGHYMMSLLLSEEDNFDIEDLMLIASNLPHAPDTPDGYVLIGYWDVDKEGAVGTDGSSGHYMMGLYAKPLSVDSTHIVTNVYMTASDYPQAIDGPSDYKFIGQWDVDREGARGTDGSSGHYMAGLYIKRDLR